VARSVARCRMESQVVADQRSCDGQIGARVKPHHESDIARFRNKVRPCEQRLLTHPLTRTRRLRARSSARGRDRLLAPAAGRCRGFPDRPCRASCSSAWSARLWSGA